jgi:hypothetical protein
VSPADAATSLDRAIHWDRAAPPDAPPDIPPPDQLIQSEEEDWGSIVGRPCTQQGLECYGAPNTCLLTHEAGGVCTTLCTPDDPKTTLVNEDSCHKGSSCLSVKLSDGATKHFCFRNCQPALGVNDCYKPLACVPESAALHKGPVATAICALPGCTKDTDCPVRTSQACSPGGTACPAGQICAAGAGGGDGWRCAKPGVCDTKSGLCAPHKLGQTTAKVGDPCKDDLACGGAMVCYMEHDPAAGKVQPGGKCKPLSTACCNGPCDATTLTCSKVPCPVRHRSGYCAVEGCAFAATLPQRACPSGAVCNLHLPYGLCQRGCSLTDAKQCRGTSGDKLGDYECRAWNRVKTAAGVPLAASPVCDFGFRVPCELMKGAGLTCAALGEAGNPTKMACRDLAGKVLANAADPAGLCLDQTTSSVP